ncbi:AMP-binding protein [Erysipelothrix sp. Poltava]|nr:AMP-binding protein [Erysipelothrix sp. Poltava]
MSLALGYFNNQVQTDRVFVQNPLNPYYRDIIYRTGDLGYYNKNGELCIRGRKDFQIKHMGHRIEMEEIERKIEEHPNVSRACCIYHEKKYKIYGIYHGNLDVKALISYLETKSTTLYDSKYIYTGASDALNKKWENRSSTLKIGSRDTSMNLKELCTSNNELKTPCYIFDVDFLEEHVKEIKASLPNNTKLCYAMKANPFLVGILDKMVDSFEVCSPGEYRICQRNNISNLKIILSGVYKNSEDIREIIQMEEQPIYTVESVKQTGITQRFIN